MLYRTKLPPVTSLAQKCFFGLAETKERCFLPSFLFFHLLHSDNPAPCFFCLFQSWTSNRNFLQLSPSPTFFFLSDFPRPVKPSFFPRPIPFSDWVFPPPPPPPFNSVEWLLHVCLWPLFLPVPSQLTQPFL